MNNQFKKPFPTNRQQNAIPRFQQQVKNNGNFKAPSASQLLKAGQKRNSSQINESQQRTNHYKPKSSQAEANPLDLDQSVFDDLDLNHIEELMKSPPSDKKGMPSKIKIVLFPYAYPFKLNETKLLYFYISFIF